MQYPKSFQELIHSFKKLPGVGQKNAERLAYSILEMNQEEVESFAKGLLDVKNNIVSCEICGNITDQSICLICQDGTRDKETICVVEQAKDVQAIETAQIYKGLYHVLKGHIDIMEGILAEDLNVASLIKRIEQVKEIIIATNPTRDGETTALYLANILSGYNVKVTRIANGLPIGGNLDYADQMTLLKSLEGRRNM